MTRNLVSFAFSLIALSTVFVSGGGGCARQPSNKSFDISTRSAEKFLREMRANPKSLARPLVILGGFNDPGFAAAHLRNEFIRATGDKRVIGVSFPFCSNFNDCRNEVIKAVDRVFPNANPNHTIEVDVIGVSMGGLVARYAAAPDENRPEQRRLRIARLFTISSPHRGAALADLPTLSRLQIDMRTDSKFLSQLSESEAEAIQDSPAQTFKVIPYVRLGDAVVGARNAAPYGDTPHWVPNVPFQDSHIGAMLDSRIIADVARRLRDEIPLTTDPPAPLPAAKSSRPAPEPVAS